MPIQHFMQSYKQAWETSDEHLLASLFAPDGCYHNTPFAQQRGHAQIKQYWQRTKLQRDITVTFEVLQASATRGIAHWHTTYQVTSEEMFAIWAASTGTNQLARKQCVGGNPALGPDALLCSLADRPAPELALRCQQMRHARCRFVKLIC